MLILSEALFSHFVTYLQFDENIYKADETRKVCYFRPSALPIFTGSSANVLPTNYPIMDFQKKGWLKQYIQTRNHHALHREFTRITALKASTERPEQLLYEIIQPTGLLYGYPTQLPYEYKGLLRAVNNDKLPIQDKNKIILLESLLYSALTSERYQQLESEVDVADAFLEAAHRVGTYYKSMYKDLAKYKSLFFYRERKGMELTEYILDSRTNYESQEGRFWTVFINSSLLFVDILFFHQWIAAYQSEDAQQQIARATRTNADSVAEDDDRGGVCNETIEKEEERLVTYYLEAALFSEELRATSLDLLKKGLSIADLDTESINSPVLKKYLLELAVLVVSADNIITDSEEAFIDQFCEKLGLLRHEAEGSILTVESFMYAHWQNIGYARHREAPDALRQHLLARLKKMGTLYRKELQTIIRKNKELHQLLQSARQDNLRTDERKKASTRTTGGTASASGICSEYASGFVSYLLGVVRSLT